MLVSLTPLYSWLEKHGYKSVKEQVIIEGIPIQFISIYNELVKESVINSVKKHYGKTITYVLSPEYLIAIMVQTFRPKDKDRILKFFEEADISQENLNKILEKYYLKDKFDIFIKQYYEK